MWICRYVDIDTCGVRLGVGCPLVNTPVVAMLGMSDPGPVSRRTTSALSHHPPDWTLNIYITYLHYISIYITYIYSGE